VAFSRRCSHLREDANTTNTVTDTLAIFAAATTFTRSEDTIGYGRSVGGAGTRNSAGA
jgi:hypothetical protein